MKSQFSFFCYNMIQVPDSVVGKVEEGEWGGGGYPTRELSQLIPAQVQLHQTVQLAHVCKK